MGSDFIRKYFIDDIDNEGGVMEKQLKLKNGMTVIIREMTGEDAEASLRFFQSLEEEDKRYLRMDVGNQDAIQHRIKSMQSGQVKRLVAVMKKEIIADGALEMEARAWKKHVAEIRLIINRKYQRLGLGKLLARELYLLAVSEKVEDIVAKIMKPQTGAIKLFEKLGFKQDAVLKDYVRDIGGEKQDLVVMRCNVKKMFQELEELTELSDWQHMR